MPNNITSPAYISDNISSINATKVNPTGAYTVGPNDNYIVCGGNSLAITLDSTSNSPVYVSSIDGTTQRTGCTVKIVIPAGTQDFVIADGGCTAKCIRLGSGPEWIVVGAKTAS
jgi:hypothetical protein